MVPGYEEFPVAFPCEGDTLLAIVGRPAEAANCGVLIIVGGPQYRAGSHRQFVLLARHLSANGIPTMRFDYRGMGDSTGPSRTFEHVHADIAAAIERFFLAVPGMTSIALWGLCDGASAAVFYAPRDPRVHALVLLNPWVRTQEGEAKAYVRHYYMRQLTSREFWGRAMQGKVRLWDSVRGFCDQLRLAMTRRQSSATGPAAGAEVGSLPERMARALSAFRGRVLFILSGNDITAGEFKDLVGRSAEWRQLIARAATETIDIPAANHTFARREWRDTVAEDTLRWLRS